MRGSCCVGKWSTGQDIYSRISVARRSYRHEEQDKQKGFILTASVSVGLKEGLEDRGSRELLEEGLKDGAIKMENLILTKRHSSI